MANAGGELVTLNVGGSLFRTTRSTLCNHPDSMLAAMFRGDMLATRLVDEQGHPFIDRDPTHFPSILAFLRDGQVPLPEGRQQLQQLKAEASYYSMAELVAAIEAAEAARCKAEEAAVEGPRRYLEAQRAEQVKAATEALAAVEARLQQVQAELAPLREAGQEAERAMEAYEDAQRRQPAQDPAGRVQIEAARAEHAGREQVLRQLQWELRPQVDAHIQALRAAREAHLGLLHVLGYPKDVAQWQLSLTHPELRA